MFKFFFCVFDFCTNLADNYINREFYADNPNEKWYTDVTEFNLRGEKAYLSPVLDGFNQENREKLCYYS